MDRLQEALPEILEGYCNKSSKPRNIAEEEAKTFLKIIEDASSYMFGYNHSTGYSMIGYTCGYFRYYYPEEFVAAYLNCASNDDDIRNGTELAKIKNVIIHNIKFGKSESEYSVDKENHALYKGLESIKFLNSQIGQELKELSYNKYSSFIDLLSDIKKNTSVNSRQLEILIGLNFFSDFGKNKYLLDINELYDKFYSCKQIKKDKLDELGLSNYLMQKYASKETAKIFKDIDNLGLISELAARIENKSFSVVDQVKFEKEYLNYITYTNDKVHPSYYIVTEFITYKNPLTPTVILHNINNGEEIKTRIKKGSVFKDQPFGEYSILKIPQFKETFKSKMINGVWQKTEDIELVLEDYEFVI